MQSVSNTLLNRLRGTDGAAVRLPAECIEFYESSYIPSGVSGFDPADAVEKFSNISLTWNSIAYRREVVSRGDIVKNIGSQTNTVTLTFSNISRYLSTWAQTTQIEGLWCVIRYVERDIDTDSVVLFIGRAGKPSTINNRSFSLSISTDFGNLNQEIPPSTFSAEDPEGRDPSDDLYEGVRFSATSGSFNYPVIVPAHHFLARLFGQRDTDYLSKQWSSIDNTPYGNVIPEILGRCQVQLIPFVYADKGLFVAYLMAACKGPIDSISDIKTRTSGFSDPFNLPGNIPAVVHLGDAGGTGTNTGNTNQFQELGKFSHLAYIEGASTGSAADVEDAPPEVTAIVKGRVVDLPDASGVYNQSGWTDNPVHLARWVFTFLLGIDSGLMGDVQNYLTSLWCDAPLFDESNSELIYIPTVDSNIVTRYRSTSVLDSRYARIYLLGDLAPEDPPTTPVDPIPFNPEDPPTTFSTQTLYRRRYTFNSPINEKVKAMDFLYKNLYPTFRGFHIVNSKGQIEIKSEKAADNCFLRSSVLAGVSAIPVDDATSWKGSLQGRLHIGFDLTTSENRKVTSAVYTALADAITLSASGSGITATASGATLAGGSSSVQSSGTVTISGTPNAGDSISIVINGISISYTLDADSTLNSCAVLLAQIINANPTLNRFIEATYSGAVVTIKAKWGTLNLDSALAFNHNTGKANPVSAPTLASSAGLLKAGTYLVAYSYLNSLGETLISPTQSITIVDDKKIDVSSVSLPAGITSLNWYMSESPGATKLIYVANNTGSSFSITALPSKNGAGKPAYNSTGEECLRIALAFSSNSQGAAILAQSGLTRANVKADSYNYPLGSEQSSVNQIKGKFRDAKNDFALTEFKVNDFDHQRLINKVNTLEVDLSGVDNWHQAFRLANQLLAKYRDCDWYNSLDTAAGEAILLDEGDLITASDDSGSLINVVTRIESLSISPLWEVKVTKARKYFTLAHTDDVRQHSVPLPTVNKYFQTVNTQLLIMDLPVWREQDFPTENFINVAFARSQDLGDWRDAMLWANYTGSYKAITEATSLQSIIGDASTVLDDTTNVYTFDNVSTVRVKLTTQGATLEDCTETEALNGKNLFALGSEANGFEMGHFTTATLVGGTDDTYDLSGFLRGRFGTEHLVGTHTNTDKFCLLDENVLTVPIDLAYLNREYSYKAQTRNEDLADSTTLNATWTGRSRQDLSIVNPRDTVDSAGDRLMEFEGRSRYGGGLRSNQGGAVNEEVEEYRVQILDGSGNTILPNGKERILPIIIGSSQPVLLIAGNSSASISTNSLSSSDTNFAYARAVQKALKAGFFIEGTASVPLAGGSSAGFEFAHAGRSITNSNNVPYRLAVANTSFSFIEYGIVKASFIPSVNNSRWRIMFSGSEVRVYDDYLNNGSIPVYVSHLVPDFPLDIYATVNNLGLMNSIIISTLFPSTVYSAGQQVEDFGSVQSSIQRDIWQYSKSVGDGVKTRITL